MRTSFGNGKMTSEDDRLLGSVRRIIRAVDLHSKRLERETGLTTPQVLVLRAIRDLGEVTTARIAGQVNLSQATVTTIIDRLVSRGLIERYRNVTDRRVVHSRLTETGDAALAKAPPLLDAIFLKALRDLPAGERHAIVTELERVAGLMRSEEHTSELQSLMRISYAVFCWKKKKKHTQ